MLRPQFSFTRDAAGYLNSATPESEWSVQPWAYDKAYLVLIRKDEERPQNDNYVAPSST